MTVPNFRNDRIRLIWRRHSDHWRLFADRRRMGRVVPDQHQPGMFRSVLPFGRLSDIANLSWAKDATLKAASRELEWELGRQAATDAQNCPQNEAVFEATSPPIRQNSRADSHSPKTIKILAVAP
jgi:hypothetical protein